MSWSSYSCQHILRTQTLLCCEVASVEGCLTPAHQAHHSVWLNWPSIPLRERPVCDSALPHMFQAHACTSSSMGLILHDIALVESLSASNLAPWPVGPSPLLNMNFENSWHSFDGLRRVYRWCWDLSIPEG